MKCTNELTSRGILRTILKKIILKDNFPGRREGIIETDSHLRETILLVNRQD